MILTIKALKLLLLPPALNLLLILSGLLLSRRAPKLARASILLGALSLYLLSITPVSTLLLAGLEDIPALPVPISDGGEQAIVILGGGRYSNAPEYLGDTVGPWTLERLRYGALLGRQTALPILVAGGRLEHEILAEADLMQHALASSFQAATRWKEAKSRNTAENAIHSAKVLQRAGIHHVYLVTHAWHMKRAVFMFEQRGIKVTPAPTAYASSGRRTISFQEIIPRSSALSDSSIALHEYLGLLWYRLYYS